MLLRDLGVDVSQSAPASYQGSVLTSSPKDLAGATNHFSNSSRWEGPWANVTQDPEKLFQIASKRGPFATSLYTYGMPGEGHMVVIDGKASQGRVIVRDPAKGPKHFMQWEDFVKIWQAQTIYQK